MYAVKGMPASVAIPLWSISVEEQFYLVWPLILRRMSRMRIIYAALVVLGLGNIARIVLVYMHASGAAAEYNTFVRIDAIAFGILIACLFGDRSPRLGLAGRLALFSVSLSLWLVISAYAGLNASPCHLRPPGSDTPRFCWSRAAAVDRSIPPSVRKLDSLPSCTLSAVMVSSRCVWKSRAWATVKASHAPRLVSRKSSPATRQR